MTTITTMAAGGLGSSIGVIPASGFALLTGTMLVLGVRGKGKRKLASGPAQLVGAVTELAFLRAGTPYEGIGEAFQSISESLAVTPALNSPGMPIMCGLWLVLSAFAPVVPVSGALLGLCFGGAVQAADSDVCEAVTALLTLPIDLVGAS